MELNKNDLGINEMINMIYPGTDETIIDPLLHILGEKSGFTVDNIDELLRMVEKEYGSLYNTILNIYYIYFYNLHSFLYVLSLYLFTIL